MKLRCFCTISLAASFVAADWQFKSRPDLSPSILNITIPANQNTSPGYLFAAPFSGYADNKNHGPRQAAPYIFTDKGELVWSGFSYFSIWATNFQKGRLNGEDILFSFEGSHNPDYGHGHGHVTILDSHYQTIKELRAGRHKIIDKHEFHIIDEKTGLVQIYQPVPRDLTLYAKSEEQQWIVDAIFQEIDIESGEVLFEWRSLDWISPDESILPINEGQAGSGFNSSDAWDYFHINSVDKNEEGDYLLSARDAAALYKINGTSGEVIWKLGGLPELSSDFKIDFQFSFQHHARFISRNGSKEVISFYDNSAHGTENKDGKTVSYAETSSGKVIEVDNKEFTAHLLREFLPPDDLLSKSQGSTQVLSDGHVIVNWGSKGAVTEYNSKDEAVFHAYFDSDLLGENVENYRAFKFNWIGEPDEDISLYSEISADGEASIYVSWNGDTKTRKWRFFELDEEGGKQIIGETTRKGFETAFKTNKIKLPSKVLVEALGERGEVLGVSDPTVSQKEFIPAGGKKVSTKSSFSNYFEWRMWQ